MLEVIGWSLERLFGGHWEVIGGHWRSLVVIGDHRWSLESELCNSQKTYKTLYEISQIVPKDHQKGVIKKTQKDRYSEHIIILVSAEGFFPGAWKPCFAF